MLFQLLLLIARCILWFWLIPVPLYWSRMQGKLNEKSAIYTTLARQDISTYSLKWNNERLLQNHSPHSLPPPSNCNFSLVLGKIIQLVDEADQRSISKNYTRERIRAAKEAGTRKRRIGTYFDGIVRLL